MSSIPLNKVHPFLGFMDVQIQPQVPEGHVDEGHARCKPQNWVYQPIYRHHCGDPAYEMKAIKQNSQGRNNP